MDPYSVPGVPIRTIRSISRRNNNKLKGFSITELKKELQSHRSKDSELRVLSGRLLGENMNKEFYKSYLLRKLHEEHQSPIEFALKTTLSSFLGKGGARSYEDVVTPKFINNLSKQFHRIDHRWRNAAHEEKFLNPNTNMDDSENQKIFGQGESLPMKDFRFLTKEEQLRHEDVAKAAIQTVIAHRDIDTGHNEDENFETMFSNFRSLLGRSEDESYTEHQEHMDRHKLVHTIQLMKKPSGEETSV